VAKVVIINAGKIHNNHLYIVNVSDCHPSSKQVIDMRRVPP
jgi:hypothetical protein